MDTAIKKNQEVFRKMLEAMCRPGKVYNISPSKGSPLMDVLSSMLDNEVSFYISGAENKELETQILVETGARKEEINLADFIIILGNDSGDCLYKAKKGSPEYPDKGATIIYYVDYLENEQGNAGYIFKGPGIAEEKFIPGIPKEELEKIREINSEFPLGIDVIVISKDSGLVCLPRSVKISRRP